ncbi:MAG: YdcF family protein, partial [Cyanobacteria bacterium J06648_11]
AFRRSRVELAQQLWESKRAPRIFTSGRGDASAMREGLARRGVPIVALGAEDCSQTTDENARFTAAELQPQGIRSILLVTDGPHMMRSLLTFRSLGFSVSPHPSPSPEVLSPPREALVVLQEYAGLLAYGVRGRYWPGRTPDLDSSLAMHLALDSQSALLVER